MPFLFFPVLPVFPAGARILRPRLPQSSVSQAEGRSHIPKRTENRSGMRERLETRNWCFGPQTTALCSGARKGGCEIITFVLSTCHLLSQICSWFVEAKRIVCELSSSFPSSPPPFSLGFAPSPSFFLSLALVFFVFVFGVRLEFSSVLFPNTFPIPFRGLCPRSVIGLIPNLILVQTSLNRFG